MKFMQRADSNLQLKRLQDEQEKRQLEQNWITNKIDSRKVYEIEPSLYALSKPKTRLSFGEVVEKEVVEKEIEMKKEVEKLIGSHAAKNRGKGRLINQDPSMQTSMKIDSVKNSVSKKKSKRKGK
jgi:hypothetical protein